MKCWTGPKGIAAGAVPPACRPHVYFGRPRDVQSRPNGAEKGLSQWGLGE